MGIAFNYDLEENRDYNLFGFPGSHENEVYGMKTTHQKNEKNVKILN
jgi:flagellum-specific peptidoglycan hydrolase FlgJ